MLPALCGGRDCRRDCTALSPCGLGQAGCTSDAGCKGDQNLGDVTKQKSKSHANLLLPGGLVCGRESCKDDPDDRGADCCSPAEPVTTTIEKFMVDYNCTTHFLAAGELPNNIDIYVLQELVRASDTEVVIYCHENGHRALCSSSSCDLEFCQPGILKRRFISLAKDLYFFGNILDVQCDYRGKCTASSTSTEDSLGRIGRMLYMLADINFCPRLVWNKRQLVRNPVCCFHPVIHRRNRRIRRICRNYI